MAGEESAELDASREAGGQQWVKGKVSKAKGELYPRNLNLN